MFKMNKKGQATSIIGELPGTVIIFVIAAITLSIGAAVLSDVKASIVTDYGANSSAANATQASLDGTSQIAGKMKLIGMVIAFGFVLAVVINFLGKRD